MKSKSRHKSPVELAWRDLVGHLNVKIVGHIRRKDEALTGEGHRQIAERLMEIRKFMETRRRHHAQRARL